MLRSNSDKFSYWDDELTTDLNISSPELVENNGNGYSFECSSSEPYFNSLSSFKSNTKLSKRTKNKVKSSKRNNNIERSSKRNNNIGRSSKRNNNIGRSSKRDNNIERSSKRINNIERSSKRDKNKKENKQYLKKATNYLTKLFDIKRSNKKNYKNLTREKVDKHSKNNKILSKLSKILLSAKDNSDLDKIEDFLNNFRSKRDKSKISLKSAKSLEIMVKKLKLENKNLANKFDQLVKKANDLEKQCRKYHFERENLKRENLNLLLKINKNSKKCVKIDENFETKHQSNGITENTETTKVANNNKNKDFFKDKNDRKGNDSLQKKQIWYRQQIEKWISDNKNFNEIQLREIKENLKDKWRKMTIEERKSELFKL